MEYEVLIIAIEEARRFIKRAEFASGWIKRNRWNGKAVAACRRASMDLTRALADLRRYPNQKE